MPVLNHADLSTENANAILSAIAPDFITPTSLSGMLQDIIDSMVNQTDQLINGVTLTQFIQDLINATVLNNPTVNGSPGQFSVSLSEDQTITLNDTAVRHQILLLNETENGMFDNGDSWDGGKHTVPQAGSTRKYQLTDLELEVGVVPGATQSYVLEINQYDSSGALTTTLATTDAFSILTSSVLNEKIFPGLITTGVITFGAGSGAFIRVDIRKSSGTQLGVGFRIKSMNFNNLAL